MLSRKTVSMNVFKNRTIQKTLLTRQSNSKYASCVYMLTLYTWSKVRHRLTSGRMVQKEVLPSGDVSRMNMSWRERLWRMEFCRKIKKKTYSFICWNNVPTVYDSASVLNYLPPWFGHLSIIRKMVLDPSVNAFQRHLPAVTTVDGELDHGHVGVWRPLCRGLLATVCSTFLKTHTQTNKKKV